MQCSVELPVKYLGEFSKYFSFDFVIASTCLTHPEYFEYYKTKRRFTILDNGAFETGKAINDVDYLRIADALQPDILVIPDVYNDTMRTAQRSADFILTWKENKKAFLNTKLMAVLPGHSEMAVISMYEFYENLSEDITWYGFPYSGRVDRFQVLKEHPEIENVHILGLPSIPEALSLRGLSNVKSIDTSLPVKLTYMNRIITDNNFTVDNDVKVPPSTNNLDEELLKINLKAYNDICDGWCCLTCVNDERG